MLPKKNIFAELFTHDHIFAPGYRTPRMIDDKIFLQIINNQLFRLMSCFTNKTKAFREKNIEKQKRNTNIDEHFPQFWGEPLEYLYEKL